MTQPLHNEDMDEGFSQSRGDVGENVIQVSILPIHSLGEHE